MRSTPQRRESSPRVDKPQIDRGAKSIPQQSENEAKKELAAGKMDSSKRMDISSGDSSNHLDIHQMDSSEADIQEVERSIASDIHKMKSSEQMDIPPGESSHCPDIHTTESSMNGHCKQSLLSLDIRKMNSSLRLDIPAVERSIQDIHKTTYPPAQPPQLVQSLQIPQPTHTTTDEKTSEIHGRPRRRQKHQRKTKQ